MFFNYMLCRKASGMADGVTDGTGNPNPLDPMDTEGEGEDDGPTTDDMLKDAENLLNSPSTQKAPTSAGGDGPGIGTVKSTGTGTDTDTGTNKNFDTGEKTHSSSVTSRLSNLGLSTNPGMP
jgi:hypothetical protein